MRLPHHTNHLRLKEQKKSKKKESPHLVGRSPQAGAVRPLHPEPEPREEHVEPAAVAAERLHEQAAAGEALQTAEKAQAGNTT